MSDVPYGYCKCGCGEKTNVYQGEPRDVVHGHNGRGRLNGRWSGGRFTDVNGYVRVLRPDHPHADSKGYVTEHVLSATEALGRPLREGEQVHHVNEDKSDNSPGNLVLCGDAAYHSLLHLRTKALRACGHPGWRRCKYCGEHGDPRSEEMYDPGEQRQSAHHYECRNAYRRSA